MKAFYSTQRTLPLPTGHRFPIGKYEQLRARLAAELPSLEQTPAEAATDAELALVHAPSYIAAVAGGTLAPARQREIGFPWNPTMVDRSRRSVNTTVQAARVALHEGVAANLAGGTHHASVDQGGGFCVFNDVAVAARLLQREHLRSHPEARRPRVAVIDLDVHQGNGTAAIFARDESVFTLSLHGEKNFPFRKVAGDLDVGLPDGTGDDAYLAALELALAELDNRFDADRVFYLAGADPHEGDRLGRLKLSFDGLRARDLCVFDWAWRRRLPLVLTMAGGYGHDIEATVQVQLHTFQIALGYWRRWQNAMR